LATNVEGVTHVVTDGAQKTSVENVFACQPPGRAIYRPSPRMLLVPDLVTMLNAGPAVQPNSAENALVRTAASCTAPSGTVVSMVWRPQPSSLLAPSSMYVVVLRLPDPVMK